MTTVQAQTTQAEATIPAGLWKSDPVHSQVGFAVKHMVVATFRGTFTDFAVTLANEDGEPSLYGAVRTDSVQVRDENLNGHLLSPDFFDSERTPVLSFASDEISRSGSDLRIAGRLTIKGVTAPVELAGTIGDPFPHPSGTERLPVRLETTVDRRQFGIEWNMELPNGEPTLANDVKLTAELFLVKD